MGKMHKMLKPLTFGLTLMLAACVTVNIYFPAAEVQKTAEEIVSDVYGDKKQEQTKPEEKPGDSSSLERILNIIGPSPAMAQNVTAVSNASIRAIKGRIAARHRQLASFYAKGNVGIANNGMLVLRDQAGLSVPQVAQVRRLVNADNADRNRLNQEVASAIKQPQNTAKVAAIFADEWRNKAAKGWWIQQNNGAWVRK